MLRLEVWSDLPGYLECLSVCKEQACINFVNKAMEMLPL